MLYSDRLEYSSLTAEDYMFFKELNSSKEVMRYAYRDQLTSEPEAKEAFLETLKLQQEGLGMQFIATLKGKPARIGIVDYEVLKQNEHGGIYEIGYFMKPEYWGSGYGSEMGRALIEELLYNHKVHKLVASCNGNNLSSENIMKKLGMTKEGVLRKIRLKDGRWDDEIKYGLLREEWEANRSQTK